MEIVQKIVLFDKYCKYCKHYDTDDDICDECLNYPSNVHSHKPIKFEKITVRERTKALKKKRKSKVQ